MEGHNRSRLHVIAATPLTHPSSVVLSAGALAPMALVSSLVPGGTRQHGPTRDGLSSQLSGTVRHQAGPEGRPFQTTQIYEGTNQIQRMVIAKKLLS